MAVRTIDCGACGAAVPYGRLSCPSCGELLASVAGAIRPLTSIVDVAGRSGSDGGDPAATAAGPASTTGDATTADPAATAPEPTTTPEPLMTTEPAVTAVTQPVPSILHEPDELAVGARWPSPADDPVDQESTEDDDPSPASEAWAADPIADWSSASAPAWPAPAPGWPAPDPAPAAAAAAGPVPGAYVPRATPLSSPDDPPPVPAPARAWAGVNAGVGAAPGLDASPARGAAAASDPEWRSLLAPSRRDETVGWVAVAGGTMAALGFLLPWSRTVIGSTGVDYFSTWGFSGSGHVFVVIGLLAVVALAVAGRRVPAWIRIGIPGLALGGLLIGLLWPYLFGPLGPLPGAYLSAIGAIVLMGAATASLVLPRHGTPPPAV